MTRCLQRAHTIHSRPTPMTLQIESYIKFYIKKYVFREKLTASSNLSPKQQRATLAFNESTLKSK